MENESIQWCDSWDWHDIPEWYEKEQEVLIDKFLNGEEHDCIDVFMKKHASERFNQYTKNIRIQKRKDKERGIIVD